MSGPAHNPKALAEFQNGETRLVYARYRADPNARPFLLEDGKAAELKGWAKEYLECFMPECGDRRLTTVSRAGKRDGFAHYRGAGGHARESLFHQQAKAAIERWVASRYPHLSVQMEQRTLSGERRADVMVTWPDDRQLAIEVQYEPLTPEAWRWRQTSYEQQGIAVVWLLGHLEPLLRPTGLPGKIALGVLHQAIAAAGAPLLWINPIEEKIGTAWVRSIPDAQSPHTFSVRPGEDDRTAFFGVDPLEDCELTPEGLSTPAFAALLTEETTRDRFLVYLARQRQEREAREARQRLEREARLAKGRQEREQCWLESDLRKTILDRYGCCPSELGDDGGLDNGISAHPEHWRAAIYHDLVLRKEPGERFTLVQCRHVLRRHGIELRGTVELVSQTVDRFLKHLQHRGIVRRYRRNKWSRETDYVQVLATIETAEEVKRQKAEEEKARRAALEQRDREDRERRVRRATAVFATRRPGLPQANPASAGARVQRDERMLPVCRLCGRPRDPALGEDGYHILCAPSRQQKNGPARWEPPAQEEGTLF